VRQPEPELIRRQEQGPAHAVAPQDAYRRAQLNRNGLRPADLLALQRAVGNRGVQRMVAQRQQLRGIIGGAVQLQGGLEDEEPLQSPLATAQRQTAEEEEEPLQGRFETAQRQGAEDEELQMKAAPTAPAQLEAKSPPSPNRTGLPDGLKTGIESLSGMAMDHVQVHYNSAQPAQLNALAYAQGSDIHLAPGQEQHLPHEAWHVVQQAQGRVKPTMQMQDGVPVNDDEGLEHEADVMGVKALQIRRADQVTTGPLAQVTIADPRGIEWRDASEFRRTAIVASGDKVGLNSASTWPVPPEQASPPPIQRLPMSNKGMKDCGFQWYDGDEWIWWNEKGKEPNHVSAIRTAQEVKHIHAKTTFKGAKVNRVDWEESDEGDWEGPKTNKKQAAEEWDEWLPQAMAAGESTIRWLKTFRKE